MSKNESINIFYFNQYELSFILLLYFFNTYLLKGMHGPLCFV